MNSSNSRCALFFLLFSMTLLVACGGGGGGGSTPPPPAQPSITTVSLPSAYAGQAYSASLAASNVGSSATWSIETGSSLPVGLTLAGTGSSAQITGNPEHDGTSNFTVRVTDGSRSATRAFSLIVLPGPRITTASLSDAVVGIGYYQTVVVTGLGEFPSWSVSAGTLPAGLTCSCSSQDDVTVIYGNASELGTFTFSLTAKSGALSATKQFTLNVVPNVVKITTTSLPPGDTATVYDQLIEAANGKGSRTWSIIAGSLPPGITLDSRYVNAKLFGMPTTAGTYPFTLQVRDDENTATANLSVTIAVAPLSVENSMGVHDGITGNDYWSGFYAVGGTGPKTWSISDGSLPPGTTFNSGEIRGKLTTPGTYSFTVRVDDASGFATKSYTMHVTDRLVVTTTALPRGSVNTPYSFQLQSTGGLAPLVWTANSQLPPGITLTPDGLLQGTPGLPWNTGYMGFEVRDSSSFAQSAYAALSIIVDGPMVISTQALPRAVTGLPYQAVPLRAYGGIFPYSWTIAAGSLPQGLSLDPATGNITGTPAGPVGDSSFTVRATDSSATPQSATRDFTIRTQSSLGRNDTIQTATFVNGAVWVAGSISPYDDAPTTEAPDHDYYRLVATAGTTAQFSMSNFSKIDPVIEVVDENGQRLQTCWFDWANKSQPCLIDTHGSGSWTPGYPLIMWFDVPGNAQTVFYVHVLDYFGAARPDFTYELWFGSLY